MGCTIFLWLLRMKSYRTVTRNTIIGLKKIMIFFLLHNSIKNFRDFFRDRNWTFAKYFFDCDLKVFYRFYWIILIRKGILVLNLCLQTWSIFFLNFKFNIIILTIKYLCYMNSINFIFKGSDRKCMVVELRTKNSSKILQFVTSIKN